MSYDDYAPLATPADAHREWHLNAGVPMGTPGCPQDACHPLDDPSDYYCCPEYYETEDANFSTARDRWECAHCGDPVPAPYDEYDDSDGLTDAQADAMTLSSAYGGDWWDM